MSIFSRQRNSISSCEKLMKRKQQSGIILIFVIITITILALLAGEYVVSVRRNNSLVTSMVDRAKLNYTAIAGIQYAIYMMQETDKDLRYKDDGRIYSFTLDDSDVNVKITPELGKVDINQASKELLATVILQNGIDQDTADKLADNIIQWRSASNLPVGNSVSDDDYKTAGLPPPQHRRFYAIDELARVYGIDADLYSYLKPLITVFGGRKISVYSATGEVMRAIGMTEDEIAKVEQARQDYYTSDERIPNDIVALNPNLTSSMRASYYRIYSNVKKDNNQISVYAVIKKRKENNTYREYESGTLTGKENDSFLSEIANQPKPDQGSK